MALFYVHHFPTLVGILKNIVKFCQLKGRGWTKNFKSKKTRERKGWGHFSIPGMGKKLEGTVEDRLGKEAHYVNLNLAHLQFS
jgi:hypothetical protein